eukprot:scaffold88380_cov68-Phaeocystis_antarctica.AAC.1
MPVRSHRGANGRARANAAAAEAKRGGEGGGGGELLALPLGTALLELDWGLRHGRGADGPLAQKPADFGLVIRREAVDVKVVEMELLGAVARGEVRGQRKAIVLAEGLPRRERRLAARVRAHHFARPLSARPLLEPRAVELRNLGGIGPVDQVAHDREPRAACQADVEALHVHAHERGVGGLDRRHIRLQGEAALHGGEPAARQLAPHRHARRGEPGGARRWRREGTGGGPLRALERAIEHVEEHAEGLAGGGVARREVQHAEDGVRDLPVDEAVGDGEELRVEREARRRDQVEVTPRFASHLHGAGGEGLPGRTARSGSLALAMS